MPDIVSAIEYLKDSPRYNSEKPYYQLYSPEEEYDPDNTRHHNLEYETHSGISITDIRGCEIKPSIDECGFAVLKHDSKVNEFNIPADIEAYKGETEELLKSQMGAEYVCCYEVRRRKNQVKPVHREQFNLNDPLVIEGPAKGAHTGLLQFYFQLHPITITPLLLCSCTIIEVKLICK